MNAFTKFRQRLARVVATAVNKGVAIGHTAPTYCPLGALPMLHDLSHRDGRLRRPTEGDAADAWGITKNAAYQFTCGYDRATELDSTWGNPGSPYFKLGAEYAKRFP